MTMPGQDYEVFEPNVYHTDEKGTITGVEVGRRPLICQSCGSMVGDTRIHDRWHDTTRGLHVDIERYEENQL